MEALERHLEYDHQTLTSLTPANCVILHKPRLTSLGGGVGWIANRSLSSKSIDSPIFPTFEHMIVSINVPDSRLLVACVYCPPGPCSNDFLDNFLSVGFLWSICCQFCICGDFNIYMDVSGGDGDKVLFLLESCSINQIVNQPTHLQLFMVLRCVILYQIML